MLEHTFLYLLGVGRRTERLWETGVPTREDALRCPLGFLRQRPVEAAITGIEESVCVV